MKLIALLNQLDVTYWAMVLLARVAQKLPLRVGYAVAALLADAVLLAWPAIRRRTVVNMRWVDPARAERLAAAAFRNYFRYMVEFLRFPALTRCDLERDVDVRGVEHLHAAMALGRGAIAVGFHVGNIDLGAAVLAQVGYPVNVVVDTFQPPRLDALIQRHREEKGLRLIPLEQAPRRALRVLRSKEILALLIDKPTPGEGVVARFFGGPIEIPAGAAFLALKTGAPVVPCVAVRTGVGRYLTEVAPFVDPREVATGDPEADVAAVTQRLVDALERWVRRWPEQWYPFRKMWLEAAPR